jgi:hypothetical protein
MRGILVAGLALGFFAELAGAAGPDPADLVLRGAVVYTVDEKKPVASAVAVRNGRIVAVGADAEVAPHIGPATQILDLAGRTIVPGFKDSHAHLLGIGLARLNVDLTGARDFEEVVARVTAAARERPAGTWIVGRGWHESKWERLPADAVRGFPRHDALSAVTPDHPVLLDRADGHALLANARALRERGVTAATVAPAGGEIIRDARGEPTGVLVDTAMSLVPEPPLTPEQRRRALALAFDEALRHGVTMVDDAGVDAEGVALYEQLAREGQLPIRVYAMLAGLDTLRRFERPGIGIGNGFLHVRAVKLYADGALGSRGAALLEPYADDPGNAGLLTTLPSELRKATRLALERGFQVNTHAIGDRANRMVLDLYENELARFGPRAADRRLRIEHAQTLDAADIPRFARLGVVASMQAIHATSDRPWAADRLGIERVKEGAYAWRKLLASGARIANGTDAPVEPLDPVLSFYAAVARMDANGRPPGGFDPEERMTREEALRVYTLDGAYASFVENELGSIEVGKRADFAVLSRDIMRVTVEEILGTRVELTIVEGRIAWRAQ